MISRYALEHIKSNKKTTSYERWFFLLIKLFLFYDIGPSIDCNSS
jgi:hypothetical protein